MSGPSPWLPQQFRFRLRIPERPTVQEIRMLAPVFRFHQDDDYRPMDPIDFISRSRFRHHRGWGSDQGYDKSSQQWKTNDDHDAKYYNIPVNFINGYGLHANGENRRPRDSNNGSNWNVFLQPRENPRGTASPDGYVPTFYIPTVIPPLNLFGGADLVIQYWLFYGYNNAIGTINHQGDWEHATALLKNGELVGAILSQHESSEFVSVDELEFEGQHWVAYSAKGTHANHPRAGWFWYAGGIEYTSSAGPRMRTWLNLKLLENQPWKDYAGAWGEVGIFASTTGPLGPWHKRIKL